MMNFKNISYEDKNADNLFGIKEYFIEKEKPFFLKIYIENHVGEHHLFLNLFIFVIHKKSKNSKMIFKNSVENSQKYEYKEIMDKINYDSFNNNLFYDIIKTNKFYTESSIKKEISKFIKENDSVYYLKTIKKPEILLVL